MPGPRRTSCARRGTTRRRRGSEVIGGPPAASAARRPAAGGRRAGHARHGLLVAASGSCRSSRAGLDGVVAPAASTRTSATPTSALYRDRGLAGGGCRTSTNPDQQVEYPVLTGGSMWRRRSSCLGDDARERARVRSSTSPRSLCARRGGRPCGRRRARTGDGRGTRRWSRARRCSARRHDQLGPARRRAARRRRCWRGRVETGPGRGVLLGLGVAAKFYPAVPARPAVPAVPARGEAARVLRHARRRGGGLGGREPAGVCRRPTAGSASTCSTDRSWDYGSFWFVLTSRAIPIADARLNTIAGGLFVVACAAIAALALCAHPGGRGSPSSRSSSSRRSCSRTRSTRRSSCSG